MAAPVSPGDVLALAQGVYKLYRKFRDAPEEMKELGEEVQHVQIMLRFFKTQASQLEFLNSPDGKELSDDLERHLRKLKRLLRKVKDIGKQWRKAKKNFLRKLPFIFYTMRVVPDLNKGITDRLSYVNRDRELALQAGVNLSPGAVEQIKKGIKEELERARAAEKSNKVAVDDAERKCRAATSALKRAASSRKPTSLVEIRTEAEKELKQSGLNEADTQKLTVLFETELQNAANQAKLEEIRASSEKALKRGTSVKSSKSNQTRKPIVRLPPVAKADPPKPDVQDDQKKNDKGGQKQNQKRKDGQGKVVADHARRVDVPTIQQPKRETVSAVKEDNHIPQKKKKKSNNNEKPKAKDETQEIKPKPPKSPKQETIDPEKPGKSLVVVQNDDANPSPVAETKKKHKKKTHDDKQAEQKISPSDAASEESKPTAKPEVKNLPKDPSKNENAHQPKLLKIKPKAKQKVIPKPTNNDANKDANKADNK